MHILALSGPICSVFLARSGLYLWLDLARDFGLIWSMFLARFGPCFLGSHPCTSELRKGGYLKMAMLEQWDTQLTA